MKETYLAVEALAGRELQKPRPEKIRKELSITKASSRSIQMNAPVTTLSPLHPAPSFLFSLLMGDAVSPLLSVIHQEITDNAQLRDLLFSSALGPTKPRAVPRSISHEVSPTVTSLGLRAHTTAERAEAHRDKRQKPDSREPGWGKDKPSVEGIGPRGEWGELPPFWRSFAFDFCEASISVF